MIQNVLERGPFSLFSPKPPNVTHYAGDQKGPPSVHLYRSPEGCWYCMHRDQRLSDAHGTPGPFVEQDSPGHLKPMYKWVFRLPHRGFNLANITIGHEGFGYMVHGGSLYKLSLTNGRRLLRKVSYDFNTHTWVIVHLPEDFLEEGSNKEKEADLQKTPNAPIILRQGNTLWVYVATAGQMFKFDSDLNPVTDTNWPVRLVDRVKRRILMPANYVYSDRGQVIVFVAQGGEEHIAPSQFPKPMSCEDSSLRPGSDALEEPELIVGKGTILMAMDAHTGTVVSKVDIIHALVREGYVRPEGVEDVEVNNTASMALLPGCSPLDPIERVYVLTTHYLVAVDFHLNTREFDPKLQWVRPYFPLQSGTSPTVSPDGTRVYIATGSNAGWASQLLAIDTLTGEVKAKSLPLDNTHRLMVPAKIHQEAELEGEVHVDLQALAQKWDGTLNLSDLGKVANTVVVRRNLADTYDMIFLSVVGGYIYGFVEVGATLRCVWRSHEKLAALGANSAMGGIYFYTPVVTLGDGAVPPLWAAGFDTRVPGEDHLPARELKVYPGWKIRRPGDDDGESREVEVGTEPNWKLPLLHADYCTRTVAENPVNGGHQVYFGTRKALICVESGGRVVQPAPKSDPGLTR